MFKSRNTIPLSKLTPQDVIHFFEQSPDAGLRALADDLRQAYCKGNDYQINTDLASVIHKLSTIIDDAGDFKHGANATIAEYVFGDRTKTGGSFNRKIQQIKQDIKRVVVALQGNDAPVPSEYQGVENTTTTKQTPEREQVAA